MIQIRFTAQGANSAIGGFNSGDMARVGEALAKHLVDEARVAEYVTAPASPEVKAAASVARPRKTKEIK